MTLFKCILGISTFIEIMLVRMGSKQINNNQFDFLKAFFQIFFPVTVLIFLILETYCYAPSIACWACLKKIFKMVLCQKLKDIQCHHIIGR